MAKSFELTVFDVDQVIADYASPFCVISNDHFGTDLRPEDYHEDWPRLWGGVDTSETKRRTEIVNGTGMIEYLPLVDERSYLTLKAIKEQRRRLMVGTALPEHLMPMRRRWIDKNFPGIFEEVRSTNTWGTDLTKGDVVVKWGAQELVDDQAKHVIGMAGVGMTGLLFGQYNYHDGLEVPEDLAGELVRVPDWDSIAEYFEVKLPNWATRS